MTESALWQRKLLTRRDLRGAGLSDADVRAAALRGEIVRLKRGWYAPGRPHYPSERHRLLVDVELSERAGVVPSHHSAAVHLGLPVHLHDWHIVHLMRTGPGEPQNRAGLVIHRRVGSVAGLDPAVGLAQTALASRVSGLMAMDAGLARGLVTRVQLEAAADMLHGHRGYSRLPAVLRLADGRRESPLESRTALVLDDLGFHLVPQFEVPGTNFRADARIGETRVLIEADGRGKYDDSEVLRAEKDREDEIRSRGWEVVRVTDDLLDRPKHLSSRLTAALARSR